MRSFGVNVSKPVNTFKKVLTRYGWSIKCVNDSAFHRYHFSIIFRSSLNNAIEKSCKKENLMILSDIWLNMF